MVWTSERLEEKKLEISSIRKYLKFYCKGKERNKVKKERFRMCSNLNCYQFEIVCYKLRLLYVNFMVMTEQKL